MTFEEEFLLSKRACTEIDSTKYAYMALGLLFSSINLIHFIVQSSLINASVHCENVSECNRRNSWEIYHGSNIKITHIVVPSRITDETYLIITVS